MNKENFCRENYVTFDELLNVFKKDFYTLNRILDDLEIKSESFCKKPHYYKKDSIEKIKTFLEEHKDTRSYFCKKHAPKGDKLKLRSKRISNA